MLGGFSMGSVMSYSLGLAGERPGAGGHPRVLGLRPDRRRLASRRSPTGGHVRAFIAHGRNDPIMDVDFARAARELLEAGGLDVELPRVRRGAPHRSRRTSRPAVDWVAATLAAD